MVCQQTTMSGQNLHKRPVSNVMVAALTALSFVVSYSAFSNKAHAQTFPELTAKKLRLAERACEDALRERRIGAIQLYLRRYPPSIYNTSCAALAQTGLPGLERTVGPTGLGCGLNCTST